MHSTTMQSSAKLSPRQFLQLYTLPQTVQMISYKNNEERRTRLILHKFYTYLQIHGRNMYCDDFGRMRSVGPPIIIPDTFPGWMSIITKDGRTAGYFSTIQQIAEARVLFFLVRDSVNGFQRFISRKRGQQYKKITIEGGQVLKYIRIYESPYYFENMCERQANRYVKCVRKDGKLIYLHYQTVGRFYPVVSKYDFTFNHVFRISELLRQEKFRLPLLAQIITDYPESMKTFSGIVCLETIQPQNVILCSRINSTRPSSFVELDVDSQVVLKVNTDSSVSEQSFRNCKKFADKWRNSIRYTFDQDKIFRESFGRKRLSSFLTWEKRRLSLRRKTKKSDINKHVYESITNEDDSHSVITIDLPLMNKPNSSNQVLHLDRNREEDAYESVC